MSDVTTTKVVKEKLVFAFRCSRTGLYFPADYVEEWGRKYGDGLGPVPVSEALINAYDQPIAQHPSKPTEAMHPLASCRAQVDLVQVSKEEYESKMAILDKNDSDGSQRAILMKSKQTLKSPRMAMLYPDTHARMLKMAS